MSRNIHRKTRPAKARGSTQKNKGKSQGQARARAVASPPASHPKKGAPAATPARPRPSAKELLGQFRRLLPAKVLAGWLQDAPQLFYERAFTPLIVLWYCVFQRLCPTHTLSAVLGDARDGGADRLSPPGKRLSQKLRSNATASYSDARQRLPWPVLAQTLEHTGRQIKARAASWRGWEVALLDGATFRLRPHGDIHQSFPAPRPGNCKKPPYWCVARVVAAFSLATGAIVRCVIGRYKDSEQALCAALLQAGDWSKALLVGDSNFGVYSVVRAAHHASAQVLVRLTHSRANRLAQSAGRVLAPGLDTPLRWSPTRQDQCPEGLSREPVDGRLVAVQVHRRGFRPLTLYLFTTLTDAQLYPVAELAWLYGQRWQVELDLRYVKTHMDLALLESRSADMARKDWLAGLIAYNLIRAVMASAAELAQVPVQVLSFSRTRELLVQWVLRWAVRRKVLPAWERLLREVVQCRLPKRKKPREPEPRAIRFYQIQFPKLEGSRGAARKKLKMANAKS